MSDIQRDLLRKKILDYEAKSGTAWGIVHSNENDMGPLTGTSESDIMNGTGSGEEDEEGRDSIGGLPELHGLTGLRPSGSGINRRRRTSIEPKSWNDYFEHNFKVSDDAADPNSSLSRSFNVYYTPPNSPNSPIFIFHHGTGSSGLSFAVTGSRIIKFMKRDASQAPITSKEEDKLVGGVLSFDMRGHGKTLIDNSNNDYSLETLTDDFITMCELVQQKRGWTNDQSSISSPPLILIGHSLGGAVVTNAALKKRLKNVIGVVVLDAVEGPAIDALSVMDKVLSTWPSQFDSMSRAIEWHLQTNSLRNKESASVSVPGILKQVPGTSAYTWILNPIITKPYWENWFTGLSGNFLSVPAARLLILAGTDRLDKPLMIGQMQGKYQLVVFAESGHFIQEDEPDKTAITLIDFWARNGRPQNIIPAFGKFRPN